VEDKGRVNHGGHGGKTEEDLAQGHGGTEEEVTNMLDTEKATNKYYAQWLGIDELIFNNKINILFNPERDNIPNGYSYSVNIYILIKGETVYISYGNTLKEIVGGLMKLLQKKHGTEYIKNLFETNFNLKLIHSIKYIYRNRIDNQDNAIILGEEHLGLFLDFFIKNNLNCNDTSWVEDYFLELVKKKYCHGIFVDGILASATDAPDMPYMSDCVQEIGINTLEEFRGKGYAQMACISMISELVSNNICPLWSADIENNGSKKLAERIGFEKYCDVLAI